MHCAEYDTTKHQQPTYGPWMMVPRKGRIPKNQPTTAGPKSVKEAAKSQGSHFDLLAIIDGNHEDVEQPNPTPWPPNGHQQVLLSPTNTHQRASGIQNGISSRKSLQETKDKISSHEPATEQRLTGIPMATHQAQIQAEHLKNIVFHDYVVVPLLWT